MFPFIWYYISLKTTTATIMACLLISILGLTDILDGFLARRFGTESHLGRIMDPVVDKTSGSFIIIALVVFRGLPLWYAIILVIRNILMILGGAYFIIRLKMLVEANTLGKFAFATTIIVMGVYLLNIRIVQTIALFISVIMLLVSTINYALIFVKKIGPLKPIQKSRKFPFSLESFLRSLFG